MYAQVKDKVIEGGIYAHYKHPGEKRYKVVSIGLMEDTWVPMVTYEHVRSGVKTTRTLENFTEQIEVGGKLVYRFSLLA